MRCSIDGANGPGLNFHQLFHDSISNRGPVLMHSKVVLSFFLRPERSTDTTLQMILAIVKHIPSSYWPSSSKAKSYTEEMSLDSKPDSLL